jgi:hypothetical protein
MVKFGTALAVLLSAASVYAFQNQHGLVSHSNDRLLSNQKKMTIQRSVSSSSSPPEYNDGSLSDALTSVTNAARESISNAVADDADADAYEAQIGRKKQMVENRMKTYKVALPLASFSQSKVLSIGLFLRQINKGRAFGSSHMNLDTLVYEEFGAFDSVGEREMMDEQGLSRRINGEFQGIVVSSVTKGSAAWTAGVRAGDVLQTTSATMGSQMWPKSTIEGVRSAMQSRKAVSGSIEMGFQRLGEAVDNQFELSLTKPIGLQMKGKNNRTFCFPSVYMKFLTFHLFRILRRNRGWLCSSHRIYRECANAGAICSQSRGSSFGS